MILEIITITITSLLILVIYTARIKTDTGKTFLFSESFLQKADERIFDFVKFIFKLYSLLIHNVSTFISHIPHKIVNIIHKIAHNIAVKSSEWIDKVTHKNIK